MELIFPSHFSCWAAAWLQAGKVKFLLYLREYITNHIIVHLSLFKIVIAMP